MNPDFLDIIRALLDAEARFIIVGAIPEQGFAYQE